jgi:hypothetical protein
MLNAVLTTAILGPALTERFLPRMLVGEGASERNHNAMGVVDALEVKPPHL